MQLTWRLVPLAMVFALGAFLLSSGAGPTSQPALADVDSISVNTVAGENEDYITVTVEAEDDSVDDLVISVASGQGTLTINDCEVDGDTIAEDDVCVDDDGTEDDEVTITAADSEMLDDNTDSEALTVTLNLELDCRNGTIEVVTITADQGTSESITVVCGFDAPNITIEKEADGDNDTFDFDFDVSRGEDCAVFKHDVLVDEGGRGDFSLDDNEEVELYCDDDAVVEIVETDDGEFSEIEDDDDCRESDSWIEFDGASVTIDLDEADDDGTVTCNFRNEGGLTPTATSTPIGAGPPSTVTVSAAPDSIPDCGGSSFVAVVVKSASGAYVSDGTVVSISANLGSVSPSTTTTLGGGVLGRYTAPTNAGGTATITATSGSRSGSNQIELLCLTATATPLPTQVPPVIQPPSTGDAGLVANGSGWTGYAGILLIAATLLGTAAVALKRA